MLRVNHNVFTALLFIDIDPIWRDEAEITGLVVEHLCDYGALRAYQDSLWYFYTSASYTQNPMSILYRPNVDGDFRKTNYVYMNHVPTEHGTAGHDDVKEVLTVILYWLVTVHAFSCIFVFGDQQSFARMTWLIRQNRDEYKQIVPQIGDFHADGNYLMAMHKLIFEILTRVVFEQAGFCDESIKEVWDDMQSYNRYRQAYETLTVAVLTYLVMVVPIYLLANPQLLIAYADESNPGEKISNYVTFL